MKKLFLILFLWVSSLQAKEVITLVNYNSPSASAYSYYMRIVDQANLLQDQYQFVMISKPGAQGLVALQHVNQSPENRIAAAAAPIFTMIESNQIKKSAFVPISSQGEGCWVLISPLGDKNIGVASLKGQKRLVVGTIGIGSGAHLTSLILGERLGFEVQPVIFRSNFDALVLMAGDETVNLVIETPQNYLNLRSVNPRLQALGISCSVRNPKLPEVKTLKEQGYSVPTIYYFTMASNQMSTSKQKQLGTILDQAMTTIGRDKIFEMIDLSVPLISGEQHYYQTYDMFTSLIQKYKSKIENAQ